MTIRNVLLTFCLIGVANTNAALLNAELVVNGGAETGDTRGWTSTGIEASATGVGPARGHGAWAFTGAKGELSQSMRQTIDLSGNSAKIDTGELASIFSINLQSRSGTSKNVLDDARAKVSFLDGSGSILDTVSFVDDINTDSFDWNLFSDNRLLSKGTRSIEILLTATRRANTGNSNDGFFDTVSVQLDDISPEPDPVPNPNPSAVPVPAAVWLFGSGLIGLLGFRNSYKS